MDENIQLMCCPICKRTWLVEQSQENEEVWLLFEYPHRGEQALIQSPLDLEDVIKLVTTGEFNPKWEIGTKYRDFVISAVKPICVMGCNVDLEEIYMWSLN